MRYCQLSFSTKIEVPQLGSARIIHSSGSLEPENSSSKFISNILYFSGAYPYDSWKKWVSLSSIISAETVSRLEPISGQIHSVTELLPNSVGDHIDEQETSIRCQNSEEREANLVCNQIMYLD